MATPRDIEGPSADELCGRLASLKWEPNYTHSVEETRGHVQGPQDEQEKEQPQKRNEECLKEERREISELQEQVQREQLLVQNLQEKVDIRPREGTEIIFSKVSGMYQSCC